MISLYKHLLLYTPFRKVIGYIRFIWFAKVINGIKTYDKNNSLENTISYNLKAFNHIQHDFAMGRMMYLIHSLLSLEFVNNESKILVLGPRTENDILILEGYGFKSVIGLDLITYSPKIMLGDMHQMPFDSDLFDVVICGWTISYSSDPLKACEEIIRVSNKNAVCVFGFDHDPVRTKNVNREAPIQPNRINSASELTTLFQDKISSVYFSYDAELKEFSSEEIREKSGLDASIVALSFKIKK